MRTENPFEEIECRARVDCGGCEERQGMNPDEPTKPAEEKPELPRAEAAANDEPIYQIKIGPIELDIRLDGSGCD